MKTEQTLGLSFKTEIEGYVINLEEDFDLDTQFRMYIETGKQTVKVYWDLDICISELGVQSTSINIKKVATSIEWSVNFDKLTIENKQKLIDNGGVICQSRGNETIEGLIELDTTQKWKNKAWNFEVNFSFEEDGACKPTYCEIFFKKNIIVLS